MTKSTVIPVWLDCDPGHDDAFALLTACHLQFFKLLGVSTVHGNASLENTTRNALSLLTAFKRVDVDVFPGASKPLKKALTVAEDIHGISGLDGTTLFPKPLNAARAKESAVRAIRDAINEFSDEIAIVATGTLTNIANLIVQYPEVLPKIRQLSIMGGGFDLGNRSPYAEFNIWCDPEAAEIVFSNPVLKPKTTLIPLNLTHQAIATQEILSQVRHDIRSHSKEPQLRQMLYELLVFFASSYKHEFGFEAGPPVHDPLAMIALLEFYNGDGDLPNIKLVYSRNDIAVTLDGEKRGMLTPSPNEKGVAIASAMDLKLFWELVLEAICNCESVFDDRAKSNENKH